MNSSKPVSAATLPPTRENCNLCQKPVIDKCKIDVCNDIFCFRCLYEEIKGKPVTLCPKPKCKKRYSFVRCRYRSEPGKKPTYQLIPIRAFRVYSLYLKEVNRIEDLFRKNQITQRSYDTKKRLLNSVLSQLNENWFEVDEYEVDKKMCLLMRKILLCRIESFSNGQNPKTQALSANDYSPSLTDSSSYMTSDTSEESKMRIPSTRIPKNVDQLSFAPGSLAFQCQDSAIQSNLGQPKVSLPIIGQQMRRQPVRNQPISGQPMRPVKPVIKEPAVPPVNRKTVDGPMQKKMDQTKQGEVKGDHQSAIHSAFGQRISRPFTRQPIRDQTKMEEVEVGARSGPLPSMASNPTPSTILSGLTPRMPSLPLLERARELGVNKVLVPAMGVAAALAAFQLGLVKVIE